MVRLTLFTFLLLNLLSCKRELTEAEKKQQHQDSLFAYNMNMGMNADSSFSYRKYNEELESFFDKDSIKPEKNYIDFDDYQFVFYNDTTTYFYYNKIEYPWCGTPGIEASTKERINEEYKITTKDLILIKSDTIDSFVKQLKRKKNRDDRFPITIIFGINKDSISSKSLNKLRQFLNSSEINNRINYVYRPLSTRERLVANAKFNHTSEDFSKINWDSAYHVDFKNFFKTNR